MDKVIGVQFAVEVGNRFALEIISQPESAYEYGGSVFGNQPALAIIDQGGNILTDVNEGTVNVSLLKKAMIEQHFNVSVTKSLLIIYGLVNFAGMYISEAHSECKLKFATELSIDCSRSCFEYLFCGYWISSAYSASPRRFQ